jgi:hypothetical protein
MDCDLEVNKQLKLYETIIKDEISKKFIFIDKIDNIIIDKCTDFHKFINFDGNMKVNTNPESSQIELFLYSQINGFEKEETLKLTLDYPKYSYIDCIIPPSKSNNNTFIKCILDTNKFPLTKEDSIILPLEIRNEKYSFTKWKKLKKELKNIDCSIKYAKIFYSDDYQNVPECDNKGNNIITISGSLDSSQTSTKNKFDILGIVDSEYKSINCNLNIKEGDNQIICTTKGEKSTQIFQTTGIDNQTNDKILIKIKNYLNYNLTECHQSLSSSNLKVILLVGSILIFLIIAFVIFLIIRKKRRELKQDNKINSLINEPSEFQE